jgi:hypothetical protein
MGVKFLDKGREGKTFYTDKIVCHLLRRGNQSPAANQLEENPSALLINKHFYCDLHDVAVTVIDEHLIEIDGKTYQSAKGVEVEPWFWAEKLGRTFWVKREELEPLTTEQLVYELTCEVKLPDRALDQISHSLEKPEIQPSKQTGSLYQYTANRTGKDGIRREYPIVEGRDRDKANDDDWYWGISYVEKVKGKWRDKSASIPRASLPLARAMMRAGFTVEATIEAAQLKFCWLEFRESWAIGEVRPEACPSYFIANMETHQILIIPSSQWGELRVEARARQKRLINDAIAANQPIAHIKEMLKC